MDVYLEVGRKRTIAGVLEWPGWTRVGRDEATALAALLHYGGRYARVIGTTVLEFDPPRSVRAFSVVERIPGDSTTDFGAPGLVPQADRQPLDAAEWRRQGLILQACWGAFDEAFAAAAGRELRKGPRGGGRQLEAITEHLLESEGGYLSRLAWKAPKHDKTDLNEAMRLTRQAIMDALLAAERGEIPARGPRGGVIWPARYFVRRVAWHALDHAWEIEDRAK